MKPAPRKAALGSKRIGPPETVDDYIARLPPPRRALMKAFRATIRAAIAGEAAEVLSYGIPAFKAKRVIVWYAAFRDHVSLFPKSTVITAHKKELAKYSTSKGTVHFSLDKPLPAALIKKLVKAGVEQL